MGKKEESSTEIMKQVTVLLGQEHVRFLESLRQQIEGEAKFRVTQAQLIRLLIESCMRRRFQFKPIASEEELRQLLAANAEGDTTRITRR